MAAFVFHAVVFSVAYALVLVPILALVGVVALADVGGGGAVQVKEMGAVGVMDEIERIAVETALSIVGGKGFGFRVPTRSSGNQKYVEELDRIVLGDKVTPTILQTMSYSINSFTWCPRNLGCSTLNKPHTRYQCNTVLFFSFPLEKSKKNRWERFGKRRLVLSAVSMVTSFGAVDVFFFRRWQNYTECLGSSYARNGAELMQVVES